MKAVLHNEAIKNVLQKIEQDQLDYIVIDQFAKREVYQHYALSALPFPDKTKFETKGESKSLAIAAASIIFVMHLLNTWTTSLKTPYGNTKRSK